MRGQRPAEVLSAQVARRAGAGDAELNSYVSELIDGVSRHLERIDELISAYAVGWSLERMPAVDRAILRLAAYEVLWRTDIPDPVAIAEAVGLAERLSTDDSAAFVNGLLARLSELKPRLGIELDPQPGVAPTASSPPG